MEESQLSYYTSPFKKIESEYNFYTLKQQVKLINGKAVVLRWVEIILLYTFKKL